MRLSLLLHGHRPLQKVQLALIRLVTGGVPGPVRLMSYRRKFFGKPFASALQTAMREAKAWTVGELELFAAFVSKVNHCLY